MADELPIEAPVRRRWPLGVALFAALWLIVLSVPQMRQLAVAQFRGASPFDNLAFTAQNSSLPSASMIVPLPAPAKIDAVQWANDHRDDAMALVQAALQHPAAYPSQPPNEQILLNSQSATLTIATYDRAIELFPNAAWLYTARLRYNWSAFPRLGLDNRVNSLGGPAPNVNRQSPSMTAAQAQQFLDIARRGAQLEPDNGFFDAMAAMAWLQQKKPALALQSLRQCARKSGYNEHLLDESRAMLRLRREQRGPLLEADIMTSAALMLPHYAVQREAARRFVRLGQQAEARGDHAAALRIYDDLGRLGNHMRDSELLIGSFVGRAIQGLAWSRGQKLPTVPSPPTGAPSVTDQRRQMVVQEFASYAAAHGRDDLAQQAIQDTKINVALQQAGTNGLGNYIFSVPDDLMVRISTAWPLGSALLLQVTLSALSWLLLSGWFRWRRPTKVLWVSALDIGSALLPGIAAAAALFVLAWRGASMEQVWGGDSNAMSRLAQLCWGIALAPPLLTAVWCYAGSMTRARKIVEPKEREYLWLDQYLLRLGLSALKLVGWLVLPALWIAYFLGRLPLQEMGIECGPDCTLVPAVLVPLLPTIIVVIARVRLVRRDALSSIWSFERARRAMSGGAIAGSLGWIALTSWSLPLRFEAEQRFESYLQRGEMSLIRERAAADLQFSDPTLSKYFGATITTTMRNR